MNFPKIPSLRTEADADRYAQQVKAQLEIRFRQQHPAATDQQVDQAVTQYLQSWLQDLNRRGFGGK